LMRGMQAAAIAVPNDKWGERPLVLFVLKPNAEKAAGVVALELMEMYRAKMEKVSHAWLPDIPCTPQRCPSPVSTACAGCSRGCTCGHSIRPSPEPSKSFYSFKAESGRSSVIVTGTDCGAA